MKKTVGIILICLGMSTALILLSVVTKGLFGPDFINTERFVDIGFAGFLIFGFALVVLGIIEYWRA